MVAAPGEEDILTKTDVVGVVMRNVDEKPEPPCVEIFEAESRVKARRIAGSIDEGISDFFRYRTEKMAQWTAVVRLDTINIGGVHILLTDM